MTTCVAFKQALVDVVHFESRKAGKGVCFTTLAEILTSLLKAEREGKLTQRIGDIARSALLIIDDADYLPVPKGGANPFSNRLMPAMSAVPSF